MNIVFFGTPNFAIPALSALIEKDMVKYVITQPEKPQGRGLKTQHSQVGKFALKHNIPVFQPESLTEIKSILLSLEIDIIIVVAYGKLIPKWLLKHPKHGCINIHASLLPRWRGASPIHQALLSGDSTTGISIMQLDEGMDTGGYWLQKSIEINETSNLKNLEQDLSELGAAALIEVIEQELYKQQPKPQNHAIATIAPKIKHQDCFYKNDYTCSEMKRLMQAFYPKPGIRTFIDEQLLILIWSNTHKLYNHDIQPGTLIHVDDDGLWIATVDGAIAISDLQLASQKSKSTKSLLNGWPKALAIGKILTTPFKT